MRVGPALSRLRVHLRVLSSRRWLAVMAGCHLPFAAYRVKYPRSASPGRLDWRTVVLGWYMLMHCGVRPEMPRYRALPGTMVDAAVERVRG